MKVTRSLSALAVIGAAGAMVAASPAEVPTGCRLDDSSTSALRIYQCQERLRIAAEAATRLSALARDGRLVGLRVEGGAILVDAAGGDSFRVVTAQASTELRKASVAVDSSENSTSVFVRDGDAAVSRAGRSVALRAGQGVDVPGEASVAPQPAGEAPALPRAAPPTRSVPRSTLPPPMAPAPAPAPPRAGGLGAGHGLAAAVWSPERAGRLMARLGRR